MPKITIDGKTVEAKEGTTILEAAKLVGIDIPHFCYHPLLTIAGNCRMCAVEVEGQPKPVISCRETVKEGMVVRTNSEMAVSTRRSVLEFILINHPIDCPVCDQSGECKLQDYYFSHSLAPSRMTEKKVKKPKAVAAGPNVVLDAERCVECARCVRFCQEITKTNELTIKERSDHSEISVYPGAELKNPYSLCTVDLCPVGALTSRDFRFKKRVWLLTSTPSVCDHCATGCNIFMDHDDGIVYRYRPRENPAVNGEWLCDEGRLSYKRLMGEDRIVFPMIKNGGDFKRTTWDDAVSNIVEVIGSADPKKIAVILSARASQEENGAIASFFRGKVGTQNIFMSALEEDTGFADDIIRDKDKNPNRKGVAEIAPSRLDDPKKFGFFFIIDELPERELMGIISSGPKGIVLITSRFDFRLHYPDIVLPKATFAEQSGTFVNRNGLRQRFEKAMDPKGEALSGVEISAKLMEYFLPFVRGG